MGRKTVRRKKTRSQITAERRAKFGRLRMMMKDIYIKVLTKPQLKRRRREREERMKRFLRKLAKEQQEQFLKERKEINGDT